MGGSIRENEFLIFWLVCSEAAISLRVIRPTNSDAKPMGVGGCCHVSCFILPFQKPLKKCAQG